MKKIIVSLSVIAAVAAVAIGATTAFFNDTETSMGNTFTAGAIDLKIDSTSHYNGMACVLNGDGNPAFWWQPEPNNPDFPSGVVPPDHYPQPDMACDGTWTETDLGADHKFFNLTDVKPGDNGEDTISLHVYGNDAWGRFVINGVTDLDNTCTEPETQVTPSTLDPECTATTPTPGAGELAESITFYAWLDQGAIPGFQNVLANGLPNTDHLDPTEGDNIQQCANASGQPTVGTDSTTPLNCDEPTVITPGTVDENLSTDQTLPDETHNIWPALAAVWSAYCSAFNAQGANEYDQCQGIAQDGRLVGSTTYYFGLAWSVPTTVGNEAQTDSLNANLVFQAVQQRNNPLPTPTF